MYLFLNDKIHYNLQYRDKLISALSCREEVLSLGILERNSIKIIRALFYQDSKIISSNIKTNLLFMIFFFKRGVVIFNGLGRYRSKYFFRLIVFSLVKLNRRKLFIFQNYADYRYFRKIVDAEVFWVPGSGGQSRKIGNSEDFVVVSRDSKLPFVLLDILELAPALHPAKIFLVGCNQYVFEDNRVQTVGSVPQEDIFLMGSIFIQCSGYGEGVPHSLVDAIVSDMKIVISKQDYIRYGLSKCGLKFNYCFGKWGMLTKTEGPRLNRLDLECINIAYIHLFDQFFGRFSDQ